MQQGFDSDSFRQALGAFTTGITIVTTVDARGNDVGVTANSFNSVSLTPPMVLWSLARTSTTIAAFLQAKHFAVHVLASDQEALAARFAQRGVDRFVNLNPKRGPDRIPLLEGCAARFECRTAFQYEGGDHVIFVGEVLKFEHWNHEPLVFKRGRFAVAVGKNVPAAAVSATAPGAFEPDFLVYLLGRAYHQLFMRVKPEIARRKLGDAEYFAISLLGVRDYQTIEELDAMVAYTGTRITRETGQQLATLGLITVEQQSSAEQRLVLTESGRQTVIELLAVAQAASVEGESALDPSESRVLRQLLATVIQSTDPGIPHPWQP
jgi:3-hydroxy-9,10-secoandrosta-1,3,5(10)-triene-9,17-dione monooxygenase reductase component